MSLFEDTIVDFIGKHCCSISVDEIGFLNLNLNSKVLVLVSLSKFEKQNIDADYFFHRKKKNPTHYFIWEDYWLKSSDIVFSRLSSLIGKTHCIQARDTSVVEIDSLAAKRFLQKNHLNNYVKGKFRYGLVYRYQLVALATFSKSCPIHRDGKVYLSHELIRFCNLRYTTVVGGLSKLLSAFVENKNPDDIMTYLDLDWSDGKGYKEIGFNEVETRDSLAFFLDRTTNERVLKNRTPEEKGLLKVYNSGSKKLILDLKYGN